jgi:hypothetical protein
MSYIALPIHWPYLAISPSYVRLSVGGGLIEPTRSPAVASQFLEGTKLVDVSRIVVHRIGAEQAGNVDRSYSAFGPHGSSVSSGLSWHKRPHYERSRDSPTTPPAPWRKGRQGLRAYRDWIEIGPRHALQRLRSRTR